MAVMLENMSSNAVVATTTVSAVYRIAQIVASIPNVSYRNKVCKKKYSTCCISSISDFVLTFVLFLPGISRGFILSITSSYASSRS